MYALYLMTALSALAGILWSLVFLPFTKYVRLFIVEDDRSKVMTLLTNMRAKGVGTLTRYDRGECKPHGIVFGRTYVAYIVGPWEHTDIPTVYLLTSLTCFNKLLREGEQECEGTDEDHDDTKERQEIVIHERCGAYKGFYYPARALGISHLTPTETQEPLIKQIVDEFQAQCNKLTVFVHGPPGSGKSTLALLVAARLKARFCKTHDPTDPGDTTMNFLQYVLPTKVNPLVILMDEVDITFHKVHYGKVFMHRDVPVPVCDKTSVNRWLDDFSMIDNVLLIMMSNQSKVMIDALDPSYIRPGRVHLYAELR